MKVYVIDDEPKIRRGLTHYIAACRPDWPEPRCAETAEAALSDPAFPETDLLFLDIQLPAMSGLELLELLRRQGHRMQAVIISGYAEFSFAQKALALQVQDYLLKPIDIQKVVAILQTAEERYLKNQSVRRAQETVQQNLHMLREKYFSNVLFGTESSDPASCARRLRELEMEDSPFVLVQYTYCGSEPLHSDVTREVRQKLHDKLRSLLPSQENLFLIFLKTGVVAILMATADQFDRILEAFQEESDCSDYLMGCSFVHQSLSELLLAYREACSPRQINDEVVQDFPVSDQTLYVDQLLGSQKDFHPYVQKVLQFIAGNYKAQLNLTIIASQVHLHTSYLSDLFKRETGTNLCNYITDYRLRVAKQALREGTAKISYIAEDVGFNDYHYFSQVFSKRVGVSPRKYRLNHYTN